MATTVADPLSLKGVTLADKYLVEGMVAEGGFSFVYRAQHQVWKQPCVLKFLKGAEELSETEREKVVAALVQEGVLLRELSSRAAAILQAHDMGTWEAPTGDSYPYLVLEWLDGCTLRQAIRAAKKASVAPLIMGEAIALFGPVAQALTATHRRGVAHRDLKPENLFVCGAFRQPDTYIKVLDFGVAKVLSQTVVRAPGDRAAQRSQAAFTPWYGAPEQFMQDHGSTGPWTDVFALALIMVETMTFRRALSGDDVTGLALSSIHPVERP
ncbi:MAG: serine/threonine protein kinase, partial [Myxococcales bacterium]